MSWDCPNAKFRSLISHEPVILKGCRIQEFHGEWNQFILITYSEAIPKSQKIHGASKYDRTEGCSEPATGMVMRLLVHVSFLK